MIYWFLILFLSAVICACMYIIYNLYNKVEYLDGIIKNKFSVEQKALNFYATILKLLNRTKNEMDHIDYRGAFKTDDEVQFAFKALQVCIENVAEEIKILNNEG